MFRHSLSLAILAENGKEHEELQELVQSLNRRITGPPWSNSMIPSLLRSLVIHFEAHFQGEEEGGIFDEILRAYPSLSPQVEQLIQEHRRMLMKADDLANRCHQGARSSENWKTLQTLYHELKIDFSEHEKREQDLLQEPASGSEGLEKNK